MDASAERAVGGKTTHPLRARRSQHSARRVGVGILGAEVPTTSGIVGMLLAETG